MTAPDRPSAREQRHLVWQIVTAAFGRLFLNTARRFAYPFAPAISQGLGVSLTAVTSLIAANQITGILSTLFGPLGDRFGYRIMMIAGLGVLAVGMLLGGFFPTYGAVLLALFMAGLGKSVFDPAIQAYIGRKVPYHRRGLAIGTMEMSWAGSSFLGLPLLGFLIDEMGWRSPFFTLGGLGLIAMLLLTVLIPNDFLVMREESDQKSMVQSWKRLARNRAALNAFGYSFFISMANDNFFVVYGIWLNEGFNLSMTAIGSATVVIGLAELCGEGLTATVSDRIGLGRSVIVAMILSGVCYMGIAFTGVRLVSALGMLFMLFLFLEFCIVTSMSLFTEFAPTLRPTMMSGFFAAGSVGRVIGAMIGVPVWTGGGILGTVALSACLHSVGLIFILFAIRQYRRTSSET